VQFSSAPCPSSYVPIFLAMSIYLWLYSPLLGLGRFFSFLIYTHAVGRTPWTWDQPVARPLPTHRTTQTQNKHTDIHVLSGIRTHDPIVRASENCSCLRPRGHCNRVSLRIFPFKSSPATNKPTKRQQILHFLFLFLYPALYFLSLYSSFVSPHSLFVSVFPYIYFKGHHFLSSGRISQ
jgi:hypothetical protein